MSYSLVRGSIPLLVSMPHVGTEIPPELRDAYVPRALEVEDTDWHLDRLYDFLGRMGASVLRPRLSRYVIDLNRPPDDAPMYPGASNTELCPTRFFNGEPLYLPGLQPGPQERLRRRETYWRPYHRALETELQRLRGLHGRVLLWDAHSIRSRIPWLFEGRLPDLNLGTAGGSSASPAIEQALLAACDPWSDISHVLNGRFKGGYITRHYGAPAGGVYAVQLEMAQSLYMNEEPPFALDPERAQAIRPVLRALVRAALQACEAQDG
ncbi:MAG: N-formylglutamate deformylase [Rhodoferax sp.]|nr:N-formylglutamate deformylase [Rhodoferax sp.]